MNIKEFTPREIKEAEDFKILKRGMLAAGEMARFFRDKGIVKKIKSKKYDITTNADDPVERLLIQHIREFDKDIHILGEESGGEARRDGYTLDGVDGTFFYERGMNEWAISLSQIKKGEVVLGMIYSPDLNEFYYARKGHGAYLNDQRIKVSQETDIEASIVNLGQDIVRIYNRIDIEHRFQKVSGAHYAIASSALAYGRLAAGKIDIAVHMGQPIWDIAPGIILVKEAGGRFTNWNNKEEYKNTRDKGNNVIASNGHLHNQAIELLKPRK